MSARFELDVHRLLEMERDDDRLLTDYEQERFNQQSTFAYQRMNGIEMSLKMFSQLAYCIQPQQIDFDMWLGLSTALQIFSEDLQDAREMSHTANRCLRMHSERVLKRVSDIAE